MTIKIKSKMKKVIMIVPICLALVSCKDFLEPDSLSTFDLEYVYSNVDDARNGVNAIYTQFQVDGFRSRLSNNMTGNTDIETQSGFDRLDGGRREIWNLTAQTNNGDLRQFWNAAYTAIRNSNISIEGLEASEALNSSDPAVSRMMNHMLGEAYTLRAYWYSMLIYYFGDVPFVQEAPRAGQDFFISRTDRLQILDQLIDDLRAVEEGMLWADELPYSIEQVNREFTLGMIGRLALQRGGYYLTPDMQMQRDPNYLDYYVIARDYTQKLISLKDRPLPQDYRQIFENQMKFVSVADPSVTDVLFEIPFALGNGDVGWNIGIDVQGGPLASHSFGSGNNYMNIPATYYVSFDTLDVRRDVTCGLYYINLQGQPAYIGDGIDGRGSQTISQAKWSRFQLDNPPGQNSAKGTGINWPMMRYPDILLMYAEAENELNGPTASAQEALARVRRRAFDENVWDEKVNDYLLTVSTNKDAFFEAIVDERGWEFGGEMIRKYELIRWNLYYDKVQETVDGMKALVDYAFSGVPLDPNNDLFSHNTNPPDFFYWRTVGGQFEIYNPNSRVLLNPDENIWTQDGFLIDYHDEVLGYDEWISRNWENYLDPAWGHQGVVRYIFPIPADAINNSQGTLTNDGYEFNF